MGRYGEIWGDMGRYGEIWGEIPLLGDRAHVLQPALDVGRLRREGHALSTSGSPYLPISPHISPYLNLWPPSQAVGAVSGTRSLRVEWGKTRRRRRQRQRCQGGGSGGKAAVAVPGQR